MPNQARLPLAAREVKLADLRLRSCELPRLLESYGHMLIIDKEVPSCPDQRVAAALLESQVHRSSPPQEIGVVGVGRW